METLDYLMKNLWYLVGAYAVIWVFIGGYLVNIGMRLKKLEQKENESE